MLTDLWTRVLAWSATIVTPDWGALVALIPLLLLVVAVAFLVITAAKWARAGPTRRGRGRTAPLGPDGRPLDVPVAWPVAIAGGAFMLAFGLVAGGPWLPAGIGLAAAGLAGWSFEQQRLRVGVRAGATPGESRGAPGAPSDSPPSADAPARSRLTPARAVVVGVAAIVVVAVAATSRVVPDAPGTAPSLPPIPSSAAQPTLPAADATLTASGIAFVSNALAAPAGRPFTVAFDNRDNVPHNLEIRDAAGKVLFLGDIVIGPKVVVYAVPALPAGQYPFLCTVHPGMTGTLTVK